jgi:hypothetical protein
LARSLCPDGAQRRSGYAFARPTRSGLYGRI